MASAKCPRYPCDFFFSLVGRVSLSVKKRQLMNWNNKIVLLSHHASLQKNMLHCCLQDKGSRQAIVTFR
jgi:hypothetical protein